jgi:selenocysteine lyase/cysteine desulfurase/uncharacterized membrane protein YGL010W
MLKSLSRFLIIHIKIGYGWRLVVIDAVIFFLIVFEATRYKSAGLQMGTAFRLLPQVLSYDIFFNLFFFLVVGACVLPALIAFVLILTGSALRINRTKVHVKLIHVFVLLFTAFYLVLSSAMQVASGYMIEGGKKSYAFTSYLQNSSSFTTVSFVVLGILLFFAPPLFVWVAEKKRPALLQDYTARLFLADLGGDFYPKFARSKINFNSGAVAPEIRFVKRYAAGLAKSYQERVPGSQDSTGFLQQMLSDCELKLKGPILKLTSHKYRQLDFFPSTSRAMEVALLKVPGPKKIILSPFEHPVEDKVSRWVNHIDGSIIKRLEFGAQDYRLNWAAQQEKILDGLLFQMSSGVPPFVVVISEVCYATGLRIPIVEMLGKLFESVKRENVVVVVDGAHAVGNVPAASSVDFDYYVFSTHKWLFAPDPCGILLSGKKASDGYRPYDCSSAQAISATTAGVRNIVGLRASLELIDRIGLDKMWERSKILRDHLISRLSERLEVIGEGTGLERSNMLAICPRDGVRWDHDLQGLAGNFRFTKKINLEVISIDPASPWVRITLPYFAEFHQINKLCEALDDSLRQ